MKSCCRAFTLMELLVVVAVVALLVAILLPSLARVREQAKTLSCKSNMYQIGRAVAVFAGEHDGRCVGYAHGMEGYTKNYRVPNTGTDLAWDAILDAEIFNRNVKDSFIDSNYLIGVNTSSSKTLSCPNFTTPWAGGRAWVFNQYATEGGELYPPTYSGTPMFADAAFWIEGPLDRYNYGDRLSNYRPDQFMMVESLATVYGITNLPTSDPGGAVTAALAPSPYFTPDGGPAYAFRHPYFKAANFLCFDGHVDTLRPTDDVADAPGRRSHMIPDQLPITR
jgi:prepilin-type N-terminal cleavage/methylation domain-containing protein